MQIYAGSGLHGLPDASRDIRLWKEEISQSCMDHSWWDECEN